MRMSTKLAALAMVVGLSMQALAAPPSYPLRVRGGRLKIDFQKTQSAGQWKMIIQFAPGSRPAGDGLRPGEGTWMDRGMRAGEPARLEYIVSEATGKGIFDYLQSTGNYYTFECYNTGKGYMQVTKAYVQSGRFD